MKISIQGSIDTPMYMSSTNIIFNCMLGIYVGLALEPYCNLLIGIFVGNFILNMLTTGLLSLGLSALPARYCVWYFLTDYYDLYI